MSETYWDIGLESFSAGDPSVIGIQKIWNAMSPPASLPTLATIVGALWADTYWADIKMDADRLASDIQAAIGINLGDAQKAAKTAFSRWYGLLVRSNMADSGHMPRTGSVTESPDVVVNGEVPLSVDQLIKQWNTYIYTPQPGLKNHTYGRAQSSGIQVPIKEGRLRMYFSDAGFNPPPTTWVKMFTYDGSSETAPLETLQGEKPIGLGERAANGNSFAFEPPGAGHYCLITVVGSEFFDNNPSNQGGNWDSFAWITNNGAAGWHNVNVATENRATLKYYNQDGQPERFSFEAHCSHLPAGTVVSLNTDDERLRHQIESRPVAISRPQQVVTASGFVPPRHTGDLVVRFDTPDGDPLPAEATVDVRCYWELSPGHPHYLDAVDHLADTRALAVGAPVRLSMGSVTFIGASE